MKTKIIKCPHCHKPLDEIYYVKNEGHEIWKYPVKNGKIDFDSNESDLVKSEFFECHYECPNCETDIEMKEDNETIKLKRKKKEPEEEKIFKVSWDERRYTLIQAISKEKAVEEVKNGRFDNDISDYTLSEPTAKEY